MKLGYIGLGKMGHKMVEHLVEHGHSVIAYDISEKEVIRIEEHACRELYEQECSNPPCTICAVGVSSLQDLIQKLETPRVVWIMVPHKFVQLTIEQLIPLLEKDDVILDGGNSPYRESIQRADLLKERGINFLDVGVSGGPSGARNGACVMVGGDKKIYETYEPLFKDIAAEGAYDHMGKSGAGHFVKMVHNGIEYGMMQAIAEGFAVMKESEFNLNLTDVADVYNHKSVIESRLVGWLKNAYESSGEDLDNISGSIQHTGEGEWTIRAAKELGIPVPVIEDALQFRKDSETKPSYTGKIVSALRNQFGGHSVDKKN